MGKHYLVLGAGMQGTAAAYDLARFGDADRVVIADRDYDAAKQAAIRVNGLCGNYKVVPEQVSVYTTRRLIELLDDSDAVLSAVPYHLNADVVRAAVSTQTHYNDLGGNTDITRIILAQDGPARQAGISVVPDCGVAPGMINILAARMIEKFMDDVDVHLYCGGLPQNPNLPYGYRVVFSLQGLANEYTGTARSIKDGVPCNVETLSTIKQLPFCFRDVLLEAAPTSGGTSDCVDRLLGRVKGYEYMTLRYPGHFSAMKAFKDFGFFDDSDLVSDEHTLRDIFCNQARGIWTHPKEPDVLYLTIHVGGTRKGGQYWSSDVLTLVDRLDPVTNFSAMERTTAFGATIVTIMQAHGEIPAGASTPSFCVPLDRYYDELVRRGFKLDELL